LGKRSREILGELALGSGELDRLAATAVADCYRR